MDNPKPLMLRCKAKSGQHMIGTLTTNSTINDLIIKVSEVVQIDKNLLKILHGFPPKTLDISQNSLPLQNSLIRSGDTLIIEEDSTKLNVETKKVVAPKDGDVELPPAIEIPGILMRRVVPADNSCLFTSINYVMTNGNFDSSVAREMRKIIAKVVCEDPVSYNEALLSKSNDEYCKWIIDDQTWGGAIEIAILSKHFQVEIVVVDTQHVRLNRFGEDNNYDNLVLLIYDGIHYDPLHMEIFDSTSTIQTIFLREDRVILQMALELANEAKHSRQFTDVANFQLRCLECNKPLKGQVEAQHHAKLTLHTNFGEV